MCRSVTSPVCYWLHPSHSSWWLMTTLFRQSTTAATHQEPYFQIIMAFCSFVNALIWLVVFSAIIAFATCSCQSLILLVIFHPPLCVPHFLLSSPDWLLPLKSVMYFLVASIPWFIWKALLNIKSLLNSNLLYFFIYTANNSISYHCLECCTEVAAFW